MNNRAQILIGAVDQTRAAFESVKRNLAGLQDAGNKVRDVLANLGVGVSLAGFAAMIKASIDAADALDEMAQRTGIAVEQLSLLRPAAELSGLTAQALETNLRRLAESLFAGITGGAGGSTMGRMPIRRCGPGC